MKFFDWINNLGATAMLPIIIFIIGVAFKVKAGQALKSAIRVGIGIFGLNMMIGIAIDNIMPVGEGLAATTGINLPIIDGGVGPEILAAFNFKYAGLMIPLGVLLNVIMLILRLTKTVNVDIWNFWSWLLSAQLVYLVTHNFVWAWVAFFATGILSLVIGDKQAPKMQEAYGLDGISFCHPVSTVYALPAPFFNKIFNAIGLDKIKADPISLQAKLGIFGDTTVIGAIIGFILALIGGLGVGGALQTAIAFAAIIILFPQVISYLTEGLIPISNAARNLLNKKYGDKEYYIGLDCAIGVGQPANIVTNVLFIPILFILAAALPGVKVLPAGCIAVHAGFMLSAAMPYFDNNIFKGLIYLVIMYSVALYAATWVAPLYTEAYVAGGGVLESEGTLITTASPYLWSVIMAWLAKLFA
ncbi:putative permease IIC component [[Clostridium] ultunense Esp]|nr:putative permease IIC component [[Clostridium] ultunense Esp]